MNKNNNIKEMQYLYDLGFIYELGSNIGTYKTIRENLLNGTGSDYNLKNKLDLLFNKGNIDKNYIIKNLRLKYKENYKQELTDEEYNKLCQDAFFTGIVQGESRTKNFLYSITKGVSKLYYIQGNFVNPLGLQKLVNDEFTFYKDLINIFFDKKISDVEYDYNYMSKGNFMRADNIVAIVDKRKNLHLMVTDNKVDLMFLLKSSNSKNGVLEGLGYLSNSKNKKTQFSDINTDTSSLSFDFSSSLMKYASISNDKNILKLVQSGSYAKSFLSFLEEEDRLKEFKDVFISLVGDTDTEISVINLKYSEESTKKTLINMRNAYREYNRDLSQDEKMKTIKKGFKQLTKTFNRKNKLNKEIFEKLIQLEKKQNSIVTLSETLKDYTSTTEGSPNMQQQHSKKMINNFLNDKTKLICYLAGCPGIGKTYAYKEGTKSLERQLTIYFSPRNAINEDFVQFFYDKSTGLLKHDDMIILNASSVDEKTENDNIIRVVNYSTNIKENLPKETNITYKPRGRERTFTEDNISFGYDEGLNKMYEEYISSDGVMKKTSEAIKDIIYKSPNINKIISFFTIQSLKTTGRGSTSSALGSIISNMIEYNTVKDEYKINSVEFERFAKICPNIFIMIDEVTGSSEGAQLFKDIKKIFIDNFYDLLSDKQKAMINLKLIVADASLPNKKLMEKHLTVKTKVEQDKIYFASIENKPPKDVYIEEIDERTIVINANAYPASELDINYNIFSNSLEIKNSLKDNSELERKAIQNATNKLGKDVNSKIIDNALDDIINKRYLQTILFVQDKKRIEELVSSLNKEWKKNFNNELVQGKDFVVLNADLTEKQRIEYIKLIEDDALVKLNKIYKTNENEKNEESIRYIYEKNIDIKFVFITSTASRGISFKTCQSMHIVLQTFNIEPFLTELSQAIYRPRGNWEFDRTNKKTLNYYLTNNIFYQEIEESLKDVGDNIYDFEYRKNVSLLNILSYLTLLRGVMNTRIKGYDEIIGSKFSIVPVGGKYTTSASSSLLEQISGYIKILNDTKIVSKWWKNSSDRQEGEKLIKEVRDMIIFAFKDSKTSTPNTVVLGDNKVRNIYEQYINAWESKDFSRILDLKVLCDYKVINGMLVFKIVSSTDELELLNNLVNIRERLLESLNRMIKLNSASSTLKQPTGRIIKLLEFELGKNKKQTLKFCEINNNYNRYVGIPLHVFTSYNNVIEYDYSNQYTDDEDDVTINALQAMKSNISQYTQCQNIFPIVSDFTGNYPFITFKSDNLESIYLNKFNKDYVLSSTSTNIFNLIMLNK